MSKTIDERVVQMEFDNKQFEKNVSTTMSTLDKLKRSLKLDGASKGLENVKEAAKKVDFTPLGNGIDAVRVKFSALEVMAVTTLSNITNSVVNAAKNLVSSFTIDPITSGFREYETQMNSVQTILANTASKGTDIEDVTAALDELNTYADQTIYNFTEMTRNIGTFTAAGVDLDKSVAAIKGIANLGAMSGSTSAQVSTAMYQLSQALATGKVSLMDWNSVVNAGMGGEQFQNALKRTAENFGYNVDGMIKKYGSFRESLTEGGWLTAEVLTETLNQISGAYSKADLIQQGYTESQAQAIIDMANTATEAATKVKTFTQLLDTMREAAGSGWAKTWQILLGDFEEAKEFFTRLSEYFGDMIGASADARNMVLADAMDSNWKKLTTEIEAAGVPLDTFQDKLKAVAKEHNIDLDKMIEDQGSLEKVMQSIPNSGDLVRETIDSIANSGENLNKSTEAMTDKLEYFQKVVTDVWQGDYKNGQERVEALTKAGYDYAEVQALVNKTVDGHKLTLEDLNETQMKAIGFTDEQVKALKELSAQAKDSGSSLSELIDNLNKPSGRELFLETIENTLKAIIEPLRAVNKAFNEVFGISGDQIYGIVEGLHRFSEAILMDEESLDKLTRTFKGVFGIFKIFTSLISGGFGLAFNVLTGFLENFNLGILDVTAFIGDLLYAVSDFITSGDIFMKVIQGIGFMFQWATGPISEFIGSIRDLPAVQSAIDSMSKFFNGIINYVKELSSLNPADAVSKLITDIKNQFKNVSWEDVLDGLRNFGEKVRAVFSEIVSKMTEVGPDMIAGLQNGLSGGIDRVIEIMRDIGNKILEAIKAVLGIHSPSTETEEIGTNLVQGLINGLMNGLSAVWTAVQTFAGKVLEFFQSIPWGNIVAVAVSAGLLLIVKNLVGAVSAIAAPLEGVGDVLSGVGKILNKSARQIAKVIKSFSKILDAKAFSIRMDAISGFVKSIAILIGALAVLSMVDTGKLWSAVGAFAVMAITIGLLAKALDHFSKGATSLESLKLNSLLLSLAASFALLSLAIGVISLVPWSGLGKATAGVVLLGGVVAALIAVVKLTGSRNQLDRVSNMLKKLASSFLVLSLAIGIMSFIPWSGLVKAGAGLVGFSAVVVALIGFTKKFGVRDINKVSEFISKLSTAFLLLAVAIRIIGGMTWGELGRAAAGIGGLTVVVLALVMITKLAPKSQINEIGKTLSGIAGAMLMLAIVAKLMATMDFGDIARATAGLLALSVIIGILMMITNLAPKEEIAKISLTLLSMSVAIGILAGIAIVLSLIDTGGLMKGIAAVGILTAFVAGMVFVTKYAQNVTGTIVAISIAVAVLATSIAALSFIDPTKLASATAAIGILMGMFALIVKSASNVKTSIGTVIAMESVIIVLGGVLYLLSGLPVESVLGTAAALSVLLIALSTSCLILAAVGKIGAGAALQGALALDGVIIIVGGLMAGIGALATYFPQLETFLDTGIGLLEKIGYGLGSFFGNIIGGFSAGVTSGLPAIGQSLSDFMTNLQPFLSGVKSIDPSIMDGVKTLAQTILILSGANLVESLTSWLTGGSSLSSFAAELVPFGMSMAAFSAVMSGRVNPDLVVAAATAGKALAEMAATLPNSGGVLGFFTGENDMNEFGNQLIPFGEAMTGFSNAVTGLKPELVQQAATAGKAIAEMAATLPNSGGVLGFFAGENDMETFASQLIPFGEAMTGFSLAVVDLKADAVEKAAIAGKSIAELASSLPNSGGVWGFFAGENDMEMFGSQLVPFGKAMTDFSLAVVDLKPESIEKAQIAGKSLVELASTIPNTGGLVDFFTGSNDLSMFGTRLVDFGDKFKQYSDYMVNVDSGIVTATTNAASSIVELQKSLPKEGGWFSDDATLADFGSDMASFGEKFAAYYEKISGINASTLSAVITQTNRLVEMAKGISGIDFSSVSSFSVALTNLGNAGIESFISAFTNAGPRVSQAATTMLTTFTTAANAQKGSMTTTFTSIVDGIIIAIQGKTASFNIAGQSIMTQFILGINLKKPEVQSSFSLLITSVLTTIRNKYGEFETVGTMLIVKLIGGIKSKEESLKTSFTTSLSSALTSIRGQYSSFYDAGRYLVEGFTAGINDNVSLAASAAASMAHSAYTSAMNALNAASPSKLFMKVGSYVPLGFAIGISSEKSAIEKSTDSMAQTALDSTKNAIAKVADAINSDMDTQPTIRPVLDLTDVETKAGRLNTLFSRNRALSIESSMNHPSTLENQNGAQTGSSGSVFSFTQNNYSPKALSRVEIYRQTKNQFSQMERMVKA